MKDVKMGVITGLIFDIKCGLVRVPEAINEKIACGVLIGVMVIAIMANCYILLT